MGKKVRGDPGSGVVGVLVALPSNQITKFALQAIIDSRVQDFGNLVLILIVDFHRRRRCDFAVRNGAGFVGFELRNMEDGVDGAHIGRELDPDGVGTGASDDLVRAKVLLGELLRRSTSLNKLSKKEDFGSDRKLWGRHPVTIRRDLVTLLSFGDRFLDLGVELVEIGDKLSGPVGSDLFVQGRRDVRVVAFVREEGRNTGSIVHSVVISELGHGEERGPVVLLIGAEHTEDLFEGLVDALTLGTRAQIPTGHIVNTLRA